jgi:hypothetical protein
MFSRTRHLKRGTLVEGARRIKGVTTWNSPEHMA